MDRNVCWEVMFLLLVVQEDFQTSDCLKVSGEDQDLCLWQITETLSFFIKRWRSWRTKNGAEWEQRNITNKRLHSGVYPGELHDSEDRACQCFCVVFLCDWRSLDLCPEHVSASRNVVRRCVAVTHAVRTNTHWYINGSRSEGGVGVGGGGRFRPLPMLCQAICSRCHLHNHLPVSSSSSSVVAAHTHTHTATQMVSFCPEEMASWFQEEQNGVAPENPWKSMYHFTIDAYQSHCYRCWKKMWHNLTIKNGWKDGWRGFCKCASTKWGKHLYPLLASHPPPPPCFVHLSDSDIPPLNEKSFLLWDVWGVFMYSLCHPTWREYDQDLGSTS